MLSPRPITPAGSPAFPLLESKLRPPSHHAETVPRTALVERLLRARRIPVVLIEAPAGYGKTTLVTQWLDADRRPFGWYSIDESDNDPVVFLTYLAAALNDCGSKVVLNAAGAPSPQALKAMVAEVARGFSSLPSPAVLVLDNVHVLRNRSALRALIEFLSRVASGSQVAVVTRNTPGLPMADLQAKGRLVRIGVEELRLNDTEAAGLVEAAGLELGGDDVRVLNERCEGWATGLYLIALAGEPRLDRHAGIGVDRYIRDYFRLELLDQIHPEDREFLLGAAAVDPISARLCDAMLDRADSAAKLEALARANLFISAVEGDDRWYRVHALLREMLQAELELRAPGRLAALRTRAAQWHESEGDIESAIECTIAADDLNGAAALISTVAHATWWSGRTETVTRWLTTIDDPRILAANPAAAVVGAALMANGGRPQMAERWARAAFDSPVTVVMTDGSSASAWLDNLRAFLCLDGVDAMEAGATRAQGSIADGSPLAPNLPLLRAFALLLRGEPNRAEAWFKETIDVASTIGATVGASVAYAALSLMAAARHDVHEAEQRAREAESVMVAANLDAYVTSAIVHVASARVALLHGSRASAHAAAARADELVPQLTYAIPWLATYVRLELAHVHLALDTPARAQTLLREIDEILAVRPDLGIVTARAAELRRNLDAGRSPDDGWSSTLTPAEARLLPLLASYLSFREIADRLEISRNTVKTQAIAVYRKLDVSSRSEAVARARELGLVGAETSRSR
jgi:LuxR family transcriptional regulator, maltose regulon positive regulatory protein